MNTRIRYRKSANRKNRIIAALLALFFGMFGAHKFYLNQTGQGFLFFLVFIFTSRMIFPITMILGIIDALRLFGMGDEEFHRKYNRGANVNPKHRNNAVERRRQRQIQKSNPSSRYRTNLPKRTILYKPNPFKKSGLKKYKDFDLNSAIEDFEKGLNINNQDHDLHFHIAKAYALTEQKEKAFYHLDMAVKLGFNDFEQLQSIDDLAYIRIQPEWESFKNNEYQLNTAIKNKRQVERSDVLLSNLNKLAELRKKGLLSQEEFLLERKKLLNR